MLFLLIILGLIPALIVIFYGASIISFFVGEFLIMFQAIAMFTLEGFFLWVALGIAAILALMTIEYEKPGWCTTVIIITLAVLEFYTDWHPITSAIHHPIDAIVVVAGYFALGTAWIVAKWTSHVYKVRDKFNEIKDELITRFTPITGSSQQDIYDAAARRLGEYSLPLKVKDHKAELYMWWVCWPLSLVWTFFDDPIKRLWSFVYTQVGTLLQNISDKAFKLD